MDESYLHKQHFWLPKGERNTPLHTFHTFFSVSPLCLWCRAGWRLLSRVGKKCSHCSRPGHRHYLHCKHFIAQWNGKWWKQNLCRFNVFKVSGDAQRASSHQGCRQAEDGQEGTGRSEGCVFTDSGFFSHLNIRCSDVISQWFWHHRLLLFAQSNVAPAGKARLSYFNNHPDRS